MPTDKETVATEKKNGCCGVDEFCSYCLWVWRKAVEGLELKTCVSTSGICGLYQVTVHVASYMLYAPIELLSIKIRMSQLAAFMF